MQKARRKDQAAKHDGKAKSREKARASFHPTADLQSSSTVGSMLRRAVSRLKQSPLFSRLQDAVLTLQQSFMADRSWPLMLVQIGLWLLLLWLLSHLHMGSPCFLLALVYWLYNTVTQGRGPPPDNLLQTAAGDGRAINLRPP